MTSSYPCGRGSSLVYFCMLPSCSLLLSLVFPLPIEAAAYNKMSLGTSANPCDRGTTEPGTANIGEQFSRCKCVCIVIPFILDVRLVDAPAGVTQEEGHTGFLIHLLSAVRAFTFLARRIQPSLSHELIVLHLLGMIFFFFFVRKNRSSCDSTEIRTHVPTSEGFKVTN